VCVVLMLEGSRRGMKNNVDEFGQTKAAQRWCGMWMWGLEAASTRYRRAGHRAGKGASPVERNLFWPNDKRSTPIMDLDFWAPWAAGQGLQMCQPDSPDSPDSGSELFVKAFRG
jgi:hypothetical protein